MSSYRHNGPTSRIISLIHKLGVDKQGNCVDSAPFFVSTMTGSCRTCLSELDAPVCLPCGHIYCSACLDTHIVGHTSVEQGVHTSWCPYCRDRFPLGKPDSNLKRVPLKFRPYVIAAYRRLFPGEEPDRSEDTPRTKEELRTLRERLKSESRSNRRKEREIKRLNRVLRQRGAVFRGNLRLRDVSDAISNPRLLAFGTPMLRMLVAFAVMKKTPSQALPGWVTLSPAYNQTLMY
ncbi:uncharacterized protein EV420DRAFT_652639 [Desarmillaria tabescens]|uniref:RING-type domain-containing protein n=1 Tax=Armillaria tabescens TaxID=1929756 RepID=A0AA39U4I8_ARMTA|nr:uncharacterized protein EV420DRAFT_652639 [Desarmillaria tabescens]KAK0466875.1 hypothetical protein EV420DRAFT_652639 [Desarmillaria tabescens]